MELGAAAGFFLRRGWGSGRGRLEWRQARLKVCNQLKRERDAGLESDERGEYGGVAGGRLG